MDEQDASPAGLLLAATATWYELHRSPKGHDPQRYVVCAGLAVLELMRSKYPLDASDIVTPKNQVKTNQRIIQAILARHGESRLFAHEGGRTTRGTVPAAVDCLAATHHPKVRAALEALADDERLEAIDVSQRWLVERARDFFGKQRLQLELDPSASPGSVVEALLRAGIERQKGGAVAQHLVGAKLALRFPDVDIENHSYTTADQQLGRSGDFVVGDTAFHVTVAPGTELLKKCATNLANGYRPVLLVPESKLQAAKALAELEGIAHRVSAYGIESFIGQNLDELGGYGADGFSARLGLLLTTYNSRVSAVEADLSIMFEIPGKLVDTD